MAPTMMICKQRGGTFLGLLLGVLVGLAAALAVAIYVAKVPVPLVSKNATRTNGQDAAEAEKNKDWDPNAALRGKNGTRPAGPGPAASGSVVPAPAPAPIPAPTEVARPAPDSKPADARAAVELGTDTIGAYLPGQIYLQRRVDGDHAPVLGNHKRVIHIIGWVQLDHCIIMCPLKQPPRPKQKPGNQLAAMQRFRFAIDYSGLYQVYNAIGE